MRMPWEITREMFLSFEEVKRLLRHVRDRAAAAEPQDAVRAAVDRVIIESLLFTGLRSSELCALRMGDARLTGGEPHLLVRAPRKGDRTVYLPETLAELLRMYCVHIRPQLLSEGAAPRDALKALFLSEHRQPYERSGLYRRVVRILTDCALGDRASVQLLRHTYGFLAYTRTGGNLLFVQRQLGHAHPMVTSIYAQFVDESYADMANLIADSSQPHPAAMHRSQSKLGEEEWKRIRKSGK